MNNNSSDADCENNIKENVDTYIEKKHIEIDRSIKLMESCEEIKKKYGNVRYKCEYGLC